MLHVLSCSGGKDSVATAILIHQLHPEIQLLVLTSEVYFDLANGISGENPAHIRWIKEVLFPTLESWGYVCKIIRSENKDYLSEFFHTVEGAKKYAEHNGRPYGFPICHQGRCHIKRDLKVRPMESFLKGLGEPYIQYLGITADEPRRLEAIKAEDGKRSILAELGYTERDCWDLCRQYDLLSPVYRYSCRQGCWMCSHARIEEQKQVPPDVWKRFVDLEKTPNICYTKWSIFGSTLEERDRMIQGVGQ